MNEVSLYAARHTDAAHIKEFFTKKLLRTTEEPIAFFDGIFYEAKNERVGGLSFHDYLIFSNKSIYLWARGISKDYLDRFNLGAVSIAAREKDQDFATLNFTIERESKDPIYLIFDFVPLSEVKKLMLLHVTLESDIENALGKHYLGEIPDHLAAQLLEHAKTIVDMRPFPLVEPEPEPELPPFPSMMSNFTRIYGDNLLERLKQMRAGEQMGASASQSGYGSGAAGGEARGYSAEFLRNQPRYPFSSGLGNLDSISLRRAEAIVRDMLNAIPEEYRAQAKKDLQEMPERFSSAVLAVNELLQNIAKNKETQNFVIQVVETAVKNDGIFGALFKGLQNIVATSTAAKKPEQDASTVSPNTERKETKETEEDREPDSVSQEKSGLFSSASTGKESLSSAAMQKERKRIRIKTESPNS
jgi:ribosomal protein L12E/L44/L45/RPP1/RPP2